MNHLQTIGQRFLSELNLESDVTRRYLACVPFDQLEYKPAPKSESLGRLAIHVAEIMGWWTSCIQDDKLDFIDFEPKVITSKGALLAYFDDLHQSAAKCLSTAKDDVFEQEWSMTYGEEVLFTLPKRQVARSFCMNHLIHHRAQLGVYLRLLGIPIPAVYGPSADDEQVTLINRFV